MLKMLKLDKKKIKYGAMAAMPIILAMVFLLLPISLPESKTVELEGVVRIGELSHYAQVAGTVKEMRVQLGQSVKKGTVLAVIDDKDAKYEKRMLEAELKEKKAALQEALNSSSGNVGTASKIIEKNNIEVAEEKVKSAKKILTEAETNEKTMKSLFEAGAETKDKWDEVKRITDESRSAFAIAELESDTARRNYDKITEVNLEPKVAIAEAQVENLEAKLEQSEDKLERYTIRALCDGIIVNKNCDGGSFVEQGLNMFDVSKEKEKYFVFQIPEEHMDRIAYGQTIYVTKKTSDKKEKSVKYNAVIRYIDYKAQYTAKELESSANKNKLSLTVKALLEEDSDLKIAQKGKVVIEL